MFALWAAFSLINSAPLAAASDAERVRVVYGLERVAAPTPRVEFSADEFSADIGAAQIALPSAMLAGVIDPHQTETDTDGADAASQFTAETDQEIRGDDAIAVEDAAASQEDMSLRVEANASSLLQSLTPEYPSGCRAAAKEVEAVTLAFGVDAAGSVVNPRVQKSTNPCFNDVAIAALATWRFAEAQTDADQSVSLKFLR